MNYILDTDIIIYFFRGYDSVTKKLSELPVENLHTTIVNYAELLYGAYNSIKRKSNIEKIENFLSNLRILPFCEEASHLFAENKSLLKKKGTPLADMDLMIASISLKNNMTLISNNFKHFERIKNLKLENWHR